MAPTLVNQRTGQLVASSVELAATRGTRRRGLLGRDGLDPSSALLLSPCAAIHTAFMRFAIDAIFVDRGGRVLRIAYGLTPWRMAVSLRAHAVIEFAAGTLQQHEILTGDALTLAPVAGAERHPASAAAKSPDRSIITTGPAWLKS